MKAKKTTRRRWLTIRLTLEEENKLIFLQGKSTCKSLSEYARSVLFNKPVTIFYRNRSADDFLLHMLALKSELNAIGNNFNQLVHKLHTLDQHRDIKTWLVLNEAAKKSFEQKTEEILKTVSEIHALWLQK